MIEQIAVAIRFVTFADLLVAFGLSAFTFYGTGPVGGGSFEPVRRRWLAAGACIGLVVTAAGVLNTASNMAGIPLAALDRQSVAFVLEGTAFGTAAILRFAALFVALFAAPLIRSPRAALSILTTAWGTAVATLAWNGHAVMDEGMAGWGHLGADVLHLWAAGLWLGALVGLLLLLLRPLKTMTAHHVAATQNALAKFSLMGTVIVAVILASGMVNALFLVGPNNIAAMWTTLYGQVLFAKLALFAAMLGLAATNRFLLTPALARGIECARRETAIGKLRFSLAFELASAVSILGLVAWLGTLEPPISAA
ncbi:MAG: copper homeostasis membrane protein CopD [Novosphingobium sp.]